MASKSIWHFRGWILVCVDMRFSFSFWPDMLMLRHWLDGSCQHAGGNVGGHCITEADPGPSPEPCGNLMHLAEPKPASTLELRF